MKVKSPCKAKEQELSCNLKGDMCKTCFRTIEEIMHWKQFTDEEKGIVLERTKRRGEYFDK